MGRIEKINQQLKREISLILQRDLEDPRFMLVTITHAQASRDLRSAKVYFSVLGDLAKKEDAVRGFEDARGKIRQYIGQRMKMRFTPELFFFYDDTLEKSARIEKTLEEIHREHP